MPVHIRQQLLLFIIILFLLSCSTLYSKQANKINPEMAANKTIISYADNSEISSISQIPVSFANRLPTDVFCTVVTSLFAVGMLIFAIVSMNPTHLRDMTYPTDSMGRKCTLDNSQFNYLYFVDPSDITKRVCVEECPRGTETSLSCWPTDSIGCSASLNPGFEVSVYPSSPEETTLGLFCLPDDPELRQSVLDSSRMHSRFQFVKAFRSIWISVGITVGVCMVFLMAAFISPRTLLYTSIFVGGFCYLLLSGVLIFQTFKSFQQYVVPVIILAIILLIIGIIILSSICVHREQLILAFSYLGKAVAVIKNEPGIFLLIPVFMICSLGLFCLCAFQHFAFWSKEDLNFHPDQVYYVPQGNFALVMQIINAFQFMWGLCFLKQAFNFLVAGCGVTFFVTGESQFLFGLKALMGFHWGSVVGGSFMINVFFLPDLFFGFIRPDEDVRPEAHKTFSSVCCACDRVFGLVRGEAMAMIVMAGMPYCNASRVAENIYFYNNDPIDGPESQSISRYFRLSAHFLVATIGTAFCYASMFSEGKVYLPVLVFCFVLNIFVCTYFVCLIADLSETLLTCDLVQMYLGNMNQKGGSFKKSRAKSNTVYQSNVDDGYDVVYTNPI